ncbi:MAG: hypothetical protein KDF56_19045, partial [Ottowia sp.]|nr:hypothetical protein [Ottowia sp.]
MVLKDTVLKDTVLEAMVAVIGRARPQGKAASRPSRRGFNGVANAPVSGPRGLARLLHVGGFPHHALAALAAEQLDRIVIVDVAELSLVDAV